MTEQQYNALKSTLQTVINNQDIINQNVGIVTNKINQLQDDMRTAIRNQQIMGNDQDKFLKQIGDIESLLN